VPQLDANITPQTQPTTQEKVPVNNKIQPSDSRGPSGNILQRPFNWLWNSNKANSLQPEKNNQPSNKTEPLEVIGVSPVLIPLKGMQITIKISGGDPKNIKMSLSGHDISSTIRFNVLEIRDGVVPLKVYCPATTNPGPTTLQVEDELTGEKAEIVLHYFDDSAV